MPFCMNCGAKIADDTKICMNCGAAIRYNSIYSQNNRESVYDGRIYKCPCCDELLNAFDVCCPSCGYELRGRMASDSIRSFYNDLNQTQNIAEKNIMIRNFPIPNTKEDIIEFMILASSNILGEDDQDIYEAWLVKFEQAYQKAQILFGSKLDFSKIQKIYVNCKANIDAEKQRKISRFTIDTVVHNVVVCIGIALMIATVIVDRSGGNASLMEIVSYIILIVSAASLFKRGAFAIDYIIGAASGIVVLLLSFILSNGSMGQLCGGIILIITAVNYFKSLKRTIKRQ